MMHLLVILGVWLWLAGPAWATPAFVQSCDTNTDGTTSTTTTCTFGSNTTAGNAIAGYYAVNSATDTITSISGCSNTYNRVQTIIGDGDTSTWFYAENIAGGACTVTVTTSNSKGWRTLVMHEVSGVATSSALDVSASQRQVAPGTGTDAVSSTAATTTVDGDYIFGAMRVANTVSDTLSPGTGFTGRTSGTGSASVVPYRSEDRIQSSAGSIAATFTRSISTSNTHTGMIALKPTGIATISGCRLLQDGTSKRLLQVGSPNGRIFQGGGDCALGGGGGPVPAGFKARKYDKLFMEPF